MQAQCDPMRLRGRFQAGNWSKILEHFEFQDRSQVDLKDKWRNLIKYGQA